MQASVSALWNFVLSGCLSTRLTHPFSAANGNAISLYRYSKRCRYSSTFGYSETNRCDNQLAVARFLGSYHSDKRMSSTLLLESLAIETHSKKGGKEGGGRKKIASSIIFHTGSLIMVPYDRRRGRNSDTRGLWSGFLSNSCEKRLFS